MAAASARLCVETTQSKVATKVGDLQPPLRGCVLKPRITEKLGEGRLQPPLRGCVLKLGHSTIEMTMRYAAASARLCVETL